MNFDSPQFAVIDFSDLVNGVEDATIDTEMAFNSSLFSYGFMNNIAVMTPGNPRMNGNPWMERFDFGRHLGFVFRRLNLTDAQKSSVKELMTKFHESMKPLVEEFKDANKTIIEKANADRKAILDQVKAGTMTRQEAGAELKKINAAAREAIKNNPASLEIRTKMCGERGKLFSGIAALLTPEQLVKWNEMAAKVPDPCK
jgi:Spy/CpxP family protein refolding chaperone